MMRKWQAEALEAYRTLNKQDFLVTATPGAGKTTFALILANKLLAAKAIQQIIVVAPTDHLRTQWADNASEQNLFLDPTLTSQPTYSSDYIGYVTTYAQIAQNPVLHASRVAHLRTLVIFDEIHHAGDGLSWGEAVKTAFLGATRRLCLTGTPFRSSPLSKIPFVKYVPQSDGTKISESDYTYGYGDALRDSVVRPVLFAAFTGNVSWRDTVTETTFNTTLTDVGSKDISLALKACLNPEGQWIRNVIKAAHERLTHTRTVFPDAGGMILATDQASARKYARLLEEITGVSATVVLSDDTNSSQKIEQFRNGDTEWLVAVRMVSEGVDIPRLMVGIWATNYRTPLFFAQAVGRFVRQRKSGEGATIFLPAIKPLTALATQMEKERQHVILTLNNTEDTENIEDTEIPVINPEDADTLTIQEFQSTAEFDHLLYNGKGFTGFEEIELSTEEEEYLGLPGLLSPTQIASLLRQRDQDHKEIAGTLTQTQPAPQQIYQQIIRTRKNINRAVARIALTTRTPYAQIHARSQTAVPGPASSLAPLETLEKRLEWLQALL